VAKIEALPGRMARVNAASTLGIEPRDLPKRMVKKAGDHVKAGETLAARSEFFDRRAVRCPVDGVISAVSRNLGNVYVREIVDLGESTGPVTVHAARELRIPPQRLEWQQGAGREGRHAGGKGQVLAAIDRDLPRHKMVTSPIYGRIREIDVEKGTITIIPAFPSPDVKAYIRGRVTAVIPDTGIEIRARVNKAGGRLGIGRGSVRASHVRSGGTWLHLSRQTRGPFSRFKEPLLMTLCLRRGTQGWPASSWDICRRRPSSRLSGDHANLGITGDNDVPFPIVVMEGFHPVPMREEVFLCPSETRGRDRVHEGSHPYQGRSDPP
jgi:hypothetical protein